MSKSSSCVLSKPNATAASTVGASVCQNSIAPAACRCQRNVGVSSTGNLGQIRSAAAELPDIELDDALSICLLLWRSEPVT